MMAPVAPLETRPTARGTAYNISSKLSRQQGEYYQFNWTNPINHDDYNNTYNLPVNNTRETDESDLMSSRGCEKLAIPNTTSHNNLFIVIYLFISSV